MIMALSLAACARESLRDVSREETRTVRLSVNCGVDRKGSSIIDESTIDDLNVWVYSSAGAFLESHYFDGLSMSSSGTVDFVTSSGGHSRLIVIGNAGRALDAPERISQSLSIPIDYSPGSARGMLMVGEDDLVLSSYGMMSNVTLHRAMCRIGLRVMLSAPLLAAGASLGNDVRIVRAGLCCSPASFFITPAEAWESIRNFKAGSATSFLPGDCLSASDIAALHAGSTVYLYSLPNYTDTDYSDEPSGDTAYSTYVEMELAFNSMAGVGAGTVVCRFYASDGEMIGLKGGCSYSCLVTVSNDGAYNSWRKDDFRLDAPDAFIAGESKDVLLHSQTRQPQSVTFSLSDSPGTNENEVFRLGEEIGGEYLQGVKVIAKTSGSGTLYCFDRAGTPMGSVPIESYFPEISIADKVLDVIGDAVNLDIQGLSSVYSARGSDQLFNSLYSVVSIEALEPVSGLYGQDFIYAGTADKRLFVNKIQWTRNGSSKNWTQAVGKSFPYRVTLACGISADFGVSISNPIIGPLEGSNYFGEAFDMRLVDNPLPAVAALNSQNTITAVITSGIPKGFCKSQAEREADGWRTWFGGTRLVDGHNADAYITAYGINQIRWDLPPEAVRLGYGAAVPIFVGKLNPHCNEYVKAQVGYYASTCYYPVGIEALIEVLNEGHLVTCLCFRPHDPDTALDITHGNFAYQGRDGGNLFSGYTGIGAFGYATNADGSYLETNWDGDLTRQPEFDPVNGSFFNSSQYKYSVVQPYNGSSFGARSGKHLAVYYYAPYTYEGGHAEIADENGHVSAKGYVSVEKWSVSSKSFFDWSDS